MGRPSPRDLAFFAVLPLALTGGWLYELAAHHILAVDFRYAFLPAAHAVLDGRSPFPTAALGHYPYVYPPLTATIILPLLAVPSVVAAWLWTLLLLVSLPLALWLFGVRDWRGACAPAARGPYLDARLGISPCQRFRAVRALPAEA